MSLIKHIHIDGNQLIIINVNDLEFSIPLNRLIKISTYKKNDTTYYNFDIYAYYKELPNWLDINSYFVHGTIGYVCLTLYHNPTTLEELNSKQYLDKHYPMVSPQQLDKIGYFLCIDKTNNIYINISFIISFSLFIQLRNDIKMNRWDLLMENMSMIANENVKSNNELRVKFKLCYDSYAIDVPIDSLHQCVLDYLIQFDDNQADLQIDKESYMKIDSLHSWIQQHL